MLKRLGIILLIMVLITSGLTSNYAMDELPISKATVLRVTYPETIDMLSTVRIKVDILKPIMKEELSKIVLKINGGDAWFDVITDKVSNQGTDFNTHFTYEGEDSIVFSVKPQNFFLENTKVPFALEFFDTKNKLMETMDATFEMTTVTYEIDTPEAGSYESINISYEYPILNADGAVPDNMPELASGRFFNYQATTGKRDIKSMSFKGTNIFLRYIHQQSHIAMDHELAKETMREKFKEYVYIGTATGFGEVAGRDEYSGGFVGEMSQEALSINQSHYGIYSVYRFTSEALYNDGWGRKPYEENGEQVYECSVLKTRTMFVGDEIVTVYANNSVYATSSQVEATLLRLEQMSDDTLDSFKIIGLNSGQMKEVDIIREIEGIVFTGYAVDYLNAPLRSAEVIIHVPEMEFVGVTDENGYYEIVGKGLDAIPDSYLVQVYLRMKLDDAYIYSLIIKGSSDYLYGVGNVEVNSKSPEDLHQVVSFKNDNTNNSFYSSCLPNIRDNLTAIYQNMYDVVTFYDDFLEVYDEFQVPEANIICDGTNSNSAYFKAPSTIVIPRNRMSISHPNNPTNREYHEYNHMIMYSMYGFMPGDGPIDINHNGFMNTTTGDSFLEGFAEFIALVTADYYDLGNGSIYANIGNFDMYYKPWHSRGLDEELAVASLLWKLYDGVYAEELAIPFKELWDILKDKNKDFGEVYTKLIQRFPNKQGTIDALFIAQGFFEISELGNGTYEANEPFYTTRTTRTYQIGDPFIDLPDLIKYDGKSKVGVAADPSRSTRKSPLVKLGQYIKTEGPDILYTVTYDFKDHPEWNYTATTFSEGGLLAVNLPPEEYECMIEIVPKTAGYSAPLVFTNEQMQANISSSLENGFLMSHDFELDLSDIDSKVWNQSFDGDSYDVKILEYPVYGQSEMGGTILLGTPMKVQPKEEVTEAIITTFEETTEQVTVEIEEKNGSSLFFVVFALAVIGGIGAFIYFKSKKSH